MARPKKTPAAAGPVVVEPLPAGKYIVVRCNKPSALPAFIADLKEASTCCKDSGGNYSAFLELHDGRKLQVEVAYPSRLAQAARN